LIIERYYCYMLTHSDIQKIIEAQREVFPTKTEFLDYKDELRSDISELHGAIDKYMAKADTYFQEMTALVAKVNRLEKALKRVAVKVGVKLDL